MEFVVGVFFGALMFSSFSWFNTREENVKSEIIKTQGFCVIAESTGQKFEKCYEVKEKPKPAQE